MQMIVDSEVAVDALIAGPDVGEAPTGGKGRVLLAPIEGSVERASMNLELDLTRDDGILVLGDLRYAAEAHFAAGHFEAAHRLWTVVAEAANRIDHSVLVTRATAMGDAALLGLKQSSPEGDVKLSANASPSLNKRRGVSYDYVSLAADCTAGLTQKETAAKWECSPATVSRAVRFVAIRDELLTTSPEVTNKIHLGASVDDLAGQYLVETKVMRWIVSDYWDRRT